MPLIPVTLHVSPRSTRRLHLLLLAPFVTLSAIVVVLSGVVLAGRPVPLPFGDRQLASGPSLVAAIGAIMLVLDLVAIFFVRLASRRMVGTPWLTVTPAGIELPRQRLHLPWDDVVAFVPRAVALGEPSVNVMLRPTFTRERIVEQHLAAGQSNRAARIAAHRVPLLQDRSGAPYLPIATRMIDMSPAQLVTLFERHRMAAREHAPAA